jgi:predicted NBD/HSP70 family sugar kinase
MYILSVAMDQFVTRIAILDMHNRYLTGIEKFELPLSGNPQALSELVENLEQVIAGSGIPRNKFIGIGIGMPGFVDTAKGINYSFLEIPDGSITEYLSTRLELPVFINNDSSLIALAELKFGAARNRKTAMVINIGWGIGLGLVINGELYQGENGFAGEFSHIPLFLNGKLCSCGKRGCLETESSLLVVLEKAREGLQSGRQSAIKELSTQHLEQAIESVITAAGKGDQFMIELLSDAGYTIGRGVAVLIHVLNPEVIILSGRGASPGIIWQTPIQQALNEHCIPRLAASTSIEISNLGYNAEIIGAAALVMENHHQLRQLPSLTT